MRQDPIFTSFNRGEVSTQLLGRTDLEHLRLAAQIQANWQPRVLGPMTFRPGSEYFGTINNANIPTTLFPFVAASKDRAVLEFTPNQLRAWVVSPDSQSIDLVTRAAVATTVPGFGSGLWFPTTQTGTATFSVDATALRFANLNVGANVGVVAGVAVGAPDVGVEHAVRISVFTGPVKFSIGTFQGGDNVFEVEVLDAGIYSLAFTPTSTTELFFQFDAAIGPENFNTLTQSQPQGIQQIVVTSIAIEGPGPMTLPGLWPGQNLTYQPSGRGTTVRESASADVVFIACPGQPQQQINRYSPTSWSVLTYKPVKGPMSAVRGSKSILMSVSALVGDVALTSSVPFFTPDSVGTLFRLFHNGQNLLQNLSFTGTATDSIRITGVSVISVVSGTTIIDVDVPDRVFGITVAGSWSGQVILQRSFSGYTTDFANYQTFTSNTTETINDYLNNEIVYYRFLFLGVGTAQCSFSTFSGGGAGVCQVLDYVSPTVVGVQVLVPFFAGGPAYDWRQSEWSPRQGFPTSVAIHEGRLWWAGADRWWGSTSDDYTNFDFDEIGDSSYIDIQVGQGPIADINWLLSLDSLLGGGDTQIIAARSDAIQNPLTPTNFNLRFSTTQGSAPIQGVKINTRAIFVNQSTRKIYQAIYDIATYNYVPKELTNLNPEIGAPGSTNNSPIGGFIGMTIQMNPDTTIHLIRSDGQIVSLLSDLDDDVKAFYRKTTQGQYDNCIVLPDLIEDMVIVSVIRNGQRYLEKFARLDECVGGTICKLVDSLGTYQGTPTRTFTAPWLANQTVAVWIDGTDASLTEDELGNLPGPFVLDSTGNLITPLPTAAENITFGLPYTAEYLSTKLAYAAQMGTAINETKRVDHLGFVLQNTHALGLAYSSFILDPMQGIGAFGSDFGSDFNQRMNALWDNLSPVDDMPRIEEGVEVPQDWIWLYYDQRKFEFPANSSTDNRIYLRAQSPRPATVVAMTFAIETND